MSFDEYETHKLNTLKKFLESRGNIKIIGAVTQNVEGAIPIELLNYKYFSSFRKLHIKAFGSTETRKLIKKWFANHPSVDLDGKVEKLLSTLLKLNLPRTPLAISMFLWIIEQQENYAPINNATMLENFIEKLFAKHAKAEIYADKFDFKNKVRLLSDISYKMLLDDQKDYQISERDLIDFIDDTLKAKKFDFIKPSLMLNHFLEKGILVEESDNGIPCVRFRFSCFMHYFLMKQMDYNQDFKKHVLSPDNLLTFLEEIDLYTGTKRDESDILSLIVNLMEEEYAEINDIIDSFPQKHDEVFESKNSIAATFDGSFLKKLKEKAKPTQSELDKMNDHVLDSVIPEAGIAKKKTELTNREKMERLWTLAAQVLRNTEETKEKDLKYNSYSSILRCSMSFSFLWKMQIDDFIMENGDKEGFSMDNELKKQIDILPVIHQMWFRMLLGTSKLSVVLKEKMLADSNNLDATDFEKFLTIFTYADIRGRDQDKWIRKFINSVKNHHIMDMTLFKLVSYYFLRSKNKESDSKYENMIGDVIVKARGQKKRNKGRIIQLYRDRRSKEISPSQD